MVSTRKTLRAKLVSVLGSGMKLNKVSLFFECGSKLPSTQAWVGLILLTLMNKLIGLKGTSKYLQVFKYLQVHSSVLEYKYKYCAEMKEGLKYKYKYFHSCTYST